MLRKWKLGAAVVADQLRENRKKEKKAVILYLSISIDKMGV